VVEAVRSFLELPDHVKAPDREWLGDGDRLERLRLQVVLLGIVLRPLACLDEISGISEGGWPIETVPKGPMRDLGTMWCP
jgi:hypothetical protein